MADDRTEAPTARRRLKARQEGQVARSPELVGAAVLLVVMTALRGLLPGLGHQATEYWVQTIAVAGRRGLGPDSLEQLANGCLLQIARMAAPVLGLVVAGGAISNLLQVGMHFSSSKLQPRWSRLDPLAGMKRLLTPRSGVELIKGFAKVSVVTFSGWQYLRGRERTLFDLIAADPTQVAPALGELAYQMSLRMVATLAVLAALDYAYQRWQFERSLRMSKQEIKDEFRETEGNPETRAKIRQRQRQAARRRMMASVPKASVVITNPTHFAVALQYELDPGVGHERSPGTRAAGGGRSSRRRGGAPRVVAKGQDLLAHRIRQIAVEHAVPVVENAPLARTLYQVVEIDEEIPPDLYRAVAEVLALVWRLDEGRRRTA